MAERRLLAERVAFRSFDFAAFVARRSNQKRSINDAWFLRIVRRVHRDVCSRNTRDEVVEYSKRFGAANFMSQLEGFAKLEVARKTGEETFLKNGQLSELRLLDF